MNDNDLGNNHLSAAQIAGYLDRDPSVERPLIEEHLAECAPCRHEIIEIMRLRGGRPRRLRWSVVAPAVAAAAVIALLVALPRDSGTGGEAVRAGPSPEGIPRFQTVSPSSTGLVRADSVVFVWRRAGAEASYRLTVTDAAGGQMWATATADTVAPLPARVRLAGGQAYFWYVDALLPSGESATTGVQEFRTAP